MMLEQILLEQEQQNLLVALVEAARAVPRDKRQPFFFLQTFGGDGLIHPGFREGSLTAYEGDIQTLAREGFIAVSYSPRGAMRFDVTPLGFKYYECLINQLEDPVERLERSLISSLSSQHFQRSYATAYQKWRDAEQLLWGADSSQQLTTIGHLCREAMQEFAASLAEKYQLQEAYPDKSKTVARVRAVLESRGARTGKTLKSLLDSLIAYWGAVVDLVQRQEHGSQKEGRELVWPDGHRVVLYTALVMLEVDFVIHFDASEAN